MSGFLDNLFKQGLTLAGTLAQAKLDELKAEYGPLIQAMTPPESTQSAPVTLPSSESWLIREEVQACHPMLREYAGLGEYAKDVQKMLQGWGVQAECAGDAGP